MRLRQTIPVLLYHNVAPSHLGPHPELTVTPKVFERQIEWLARTGHSPLSANGVIDCLEQRRSFPEKPILITFDDGYVDIATYALPVLQSYGFVATVFVATRLLGLSLPWDGRKVMTADAVTSWASRGIEFGAHTRTHADLRNLTASQLESEVLGSGEDLRSLAPVTSFAYPFGFYTEQAVELVTRAYSTAFTTQEGINSTDCDRHRLHRSMVLPDDSMLSFRFRTWIGWSPVRGLRARARRTLGR